MSFVGIEVNEKAIIHHKQILQILLLRELNFDQYVPYSWTGMFSKASEAIITQHAIQNGITTTKETFVKWLAFTTIQNDYYPSFKCFEILLGTICPIIEQNGANQNELSMFWDGAKNILPYCISIIRDIRMLDITDAKSLQILNEALSIVSIIGTLKPSIEFESFLRNIYG